MFSRRLSSVTFHAATAACVSVATAAGALAAKPSIAPPAEVLDLANWKLTLPYNTKRRKGNPDEVVQPELATFHDAECFHTSPEGDAIVFRAACDGKGTESSKYPRSELREMKPGADDEARWSTTDGGVHTFEAEIAVTQTPVTKEHVVCTQVHDKDDDVLMVRLEDDTLFIERADASDVILDTEYELGDRFTLKLVASGESIKAWHDGEQVMDWSVKAKGCYFKVGCYTQSNREKEKQDGSYGEVKLYKLRLEHSK